MDEQMRLFESELRQSSGYNPRPPFMPSSVRAFMPSSVRSNQMQGGGGGAPHPHREGAAVPPPPSYPRPAYMHNPQPSSITRFQNQRPGLGQLPRAPNIVPKSFHAAPQINKSAQEDDDDIMATLMKYEKEVKEEKGADKKKRKSEDQGDGSSSKLMRPSSVAGAGGQPTPTQKSGTNVTPEEIKQKAKQMVEAVKASQVIEKTKKLAQQAQKGGKKQKKIIRMAGGQMWEDNSLHNWDTNDFRIFCGDLGNDVTDEVLNRTFGKYPSFQQAKVVRDKRSNKTKGYGFVSFKDPADFTKAIKEMDGKYVGSRPIKLRRSNWKDRNIDQVKTKQKTKVAMGYKA